MDRIGPDDLDSALIEAMEQEARRGRLMTTPSNVQGQLPGAPIVVPPVEAPPLLIRLKCLNFTTGRFDNMGVVDSNTDGQIPQLTGLLFTANIPFTYDPGNNVFNRARGNHTIPMLLPGVYNASNNSVQFANYNNRGGHFPVNVTAVAGGGQTITPHIQGLDPVSGVWYDILIGAAIAAIGMTVLKVYPGTGAIPNGAADDVLPQFFRVSMVHSAGGNFSYSVGANLVV
jgi:hypothetical protein